MNMKNLFIIPAMFLMLLPNLVSASTVRGGESVVITKEQIVEGDFYSVAEEIFNSGEIKGDLLTTGISLTTNGLVGGDITAVSGKVDVSGVVNDDVRVMSGEVVISGEIKGDLVVVGGDLKVLSTASIAGDVIIYGASADIAGSVGRNIHGSIENLRLDGKVAGEVNIKTTNLTLGERADIAGNLTYTSPKELVRAQNATVVGQVSRQDVVLEKASAKDFVIVFLVLLFSALAWYLFFRQILFKVIDQSIVHGVRSFMIGFGFIFVLPIASIILLFSTLGSFIGLALLCMYVIVLLAGVIAVGPIVGHLLLKNFSKFSGEKHAILSIILGVLATVALFYVPFLGFILILFIAILAIGSVAVLTYRTLRNF